MKKKTLLNGLLFGALAGMSQAGSAALTGTDTVTIDFPSSIMTDAAYGYGANDAPTSDGTCPSTGGAPCYEEDGFVIGTPANGDMTNHVHRVNVSLKDRAMAYHADSSGIYLRAADLSAFNLKSMEFDAEFKVGGENLIYGPDMDFTNPLSDDQADIGLLGPDERWEIFGFSNAVNPDIVANDGYPTATAYATIANGFVGTVGTDAGNDFVLGEAFKDVGAIWIHYFGFPGKPAGISFYMETDNLLLGAPEVANVPVPAAVWMFGSGLFGLLSLNRRNAAHKA
ncbi:MAG: hypothetical protein ACU836_08725 [Gammaproteobacteria bacterium]